MPLIQLLFRAAIFFKILLAFDAELSSSLVSSSNNDVLITEGVLL